jgi:branched-chain amino acid transport system substrate-binding protein
MRNKPLILAAAAAAAVAAGVLLFLYLAGPRPGRADEYLVGFAGPLTGKQADYGRSVSQGAQLRADEINDAGGVNGTKIRLLLGDDQATPTQAVTVAQEFAANPRVLLVLGHFNSSCSNAAKPIYRDAKLPQVSYGSTNDDVPEGSEWTFRTPYKNSLQGRSLARFARHKLKAQRVAIVAENDAYGKSLAKEFKEEAVAVGLEIVGEESYEVEATDYRPIFIKLKAAAPDALLLAGFHPQIQAMARQARDLGVKSTFLAGDGVGSSTEYIKNAGDAAEGTYATGPFLIEQRRDAIADFRSKYTKKYGGEPDSWAVYAYDAVGLAAEAIKAAGPNRAAIRDYLRGLNSPERAYAGLVGPIYFDANRDAVNRDVTIAVVRNGRYEVVDWSAQDR